VIITEPKFPELVLARHLVVNYSNTEFCEFSLFAGKRSRTERRKVCVLHVRISL